MDAQIAVEAYNNTLQAGFAGIAVILAIVGLVVAGIFWRLVGVWNRRSNDQSELVRAVVTTSQAAKNTAEHNAEMLKEIRVMRENQATMVGFLTEVDTNVKLVKEQGVRADKNIQLTLDDLQRFQRSVVPKLDTVINALEQHDTRATHRHKALLDAGVENQQVIVTDLDEFDNLLKGLMTVIGNIRTDVASLEAAQRKIVQYTKPVDTDELTDGGNSLLSA